MPATFYDIIWIFFIYACIGWALEVAYATLNTGSFINRGFLNGPWCPIYGVGMVMAVSVLYPLRDNLLILFFGSLLFSTLLELVTGFAMEKIFHNKWWDYSDLPFNFKGYICLKFSIYWGGAAVMVIDVIHPIIFKLMKLIPTILGIIMLAIFSILFICDITFTVITITKLNKHIRAIDEIAHRLHELSDELGENIHESTIAIEEKNQQFKEKHQDDLDKLHDELEKAREHYKTLMSHSPLGSKRIIKAFPNMRSTHRDEIFQKYRERINKK